MNFRTRILGFATILALLATFVLHGLPNIPEKALYGAWGVTAALFVAWLALNHALVMALLTKKSTRYGANIAFVIFLVLGILSFVNVLGKEYHWRKDLTRSGVNSLSSQTAKVLAELPQDVKALFFAKLQTKDKGEALLKNYAYNAKRFKYEFVDVDRQPTLTTSMGVKAADTVVLVLEGSQKRVTVEGVTEEKLTNGLIKLLRQKEQVVYFTVGHGEHDPSSDTDPMGYGLFRAELFKQGYTVKDLNLLTEGKVPADASVIIVGGPKTAFFPKELELLTAWLGAGGRGFLAVDLDVASNGLARGSAQLGEALRAFGVSANQSMLVDPTSRSANVEPQVLLGFAASTEHPVSKDFPRSKLANILAPNFIFPMTTHLSVQPSPAWVLTPLAVTTGQAWAESDWGSLKAGSVRYEKEKDFQGRMNLAVAVEAAKPAPKEGEKAEEKPGTRLAVFANAIFAANSMLDKIGNRDLALNAMAWLTDDERFISIRATEDQDGLRQVSSSVMGLVLLAVVLVPLLTLLAGMTIWWRRSKL